MLFVYRLIYYTHTHNVTEAFILFIPLRVYINNLNMA